MPVDIVDIDLSASTGSPSQPTYNDPVVIGRSSSLPDAAPGFNNPEPYSASSEVANDFGTDSDVHVASQKLEEMNVDAWHVAVLRETETTEVLGDSDTNSTDRGTVSTTPMSGEMVPEIVVDGTVQDVVPKTVTPADADESPDEGTAFYNPDSGSVVVGTTTSGAASGIEVTYRKLSWPEMFKQLTPLELDIACLADVRCGRQHIGDLDELVSWASGNHVAVIAALENGNTYTTDEAAMTAAHDIGAFVPSGNLMTIAHKSGEDVAATVVGQLGTARPWFDPMYDGDGLPISTDLYRQPLVGNPNQPQTFEGGDENSAGPTNVLIRKQGVLVLSNSLSTAGEGSDYRYIDIRRTESFIAVEAERELVNLRLREDYIGFDRDGRVKIIHALNNLRQYEGGRGPLQDLEIDVPKRSELTESQRAGRIWGPIRVTATLAQNVHRFSVVLEATV